MRNLFEMYGGVRRGSPIASVALEQAVVGGDVVPPPPGHARPVSTAVAMNVMRQAGVLPLFSATTPALQQ